MNDIKLEWHFSKWNNRDGNGCGDGFTDGDGIGGGWGFAFNYGDGRGHLQRSSSDQGVIA